MGKGPSVLLVEDDQNDRLLFADAMRRTGSAALQTVSDGQQAIEYLEGKGDYADRSKYPLPNVVVLDLKMPYVNGFDFLRWRSTSLFTSIPVIVLEGTGREIEHQMASAMGATKSYLKPLGLESLFSIAREICAFASDKPLQSSSFST